MEKSPVVLEFFLPEGSFGVTNYYLSGDDGRGVPRRACAACGGSRPRACASSRRSWADFLAHPPVASSFASSPSG